MCKDEEVTPDEPRKRPRITLPRIGSPWNNAEVVDQCFDPFWLMPEHLRPFRLTLRAIFDSGIVIPSPREMPCWTQHPPRKAKIGMTLRKVYASQGSTGMYDSAYILVDMHGGYKVIDSKYVPLRDGEYLTDPAYNTDERLLGLVVDIAEGFLGDFIADETKYRRELNAYYPYRRHWEVELVKQLKREGLITIAEEEIVRIEAWRRVADRDSGGKYHQSGEWNTIKPISIEEKLAGFSYLVKHVRAGVSSLKQRVERLQRAKNADKLLIKFDDEGAGSGSARQQLQPFLIPPPGSGGAMEFYHWCLERHGCWAWNNMFNLSTCHQVYQLASLDDIKSMAPVDLPRGNHGLINELTRHAELNLQQFPWGLPTHKLYEAMNGVNRGHQYYTRWARYLLIDLERWYFSQPEDIKENLQTTHLLGWHLSNGLLARCMNMCLPY
ncbi:hypothetical protein BJX76DRAFT_364319 [Aspergillus varians]